MPLALVLAHLATAMAHLPSPLHAPLGLWLQAAPPALTSALATLPVAAPSPATAYRQIRYREINR